MIIATIAVLFLVAILWLNGKRARQLAFPSGASVPSHYKAFTEIEKQLREATRTDQPPELWDATLWHLKKAETQLVANYLRGLRDDFAATAIPLSIALLSGISGFAQNGSSQREVERRPKAEDTRRKDTTGELDHEKRTSESGDIERVLPPGGRAVPNDTQKQPPRRFVPDRFGDHKATRPATSDTARQSAHQRNAEKTMEEIRQSGLPASHASSQQTEQSPRTVHANHQHTAKKHELHGDRGCNELREEAEREKCREAKEKSDKAQQ